MKFSITAAAIGMLFFATSAAQQPPAVSARVLLHQFTSAAEPLRRAETYSSLSGVLQQRWGPVPPAQLDSIADGLVTLALHLRPRNPDDKLLRVDAMGIIGRGAAKDARIPYTGAFKRLKHIFETAKDPGASGAALATISTLADRQLALDFLADVARSKTAGPPVAASRAIEYMINDFGQIGRARVMALDADGSVKDEEAKELLVLFRNNGYKPLR